MMSIATCHAAWVTRFTRPFIRLLGDETIGNVQSPLRLGETTEVLPDIMVLPSRPHFDADAHPAAEDVLLVVEVAEPTLVSFFRRPHEGM